MTTRPVDSDTPNVGGGVPVVEATGVAVNVASCDVWCPGSVVSTPDSVLSGGGVLYTPSTPGGSVGGVSGGVLSVPGFVQVGWGSSGWGVSSRGHILSSVEEAWGYGHSFTPPVDPVESSVGSFVSGVGDCASDVFECPCEPSVGSGSVLGIDVSGLGVWDSFLVSVGGVSAGGGVVSGVGVSLSFVEGASGVLGCVSGGGLSVVPGVGVPLWEGFVADFSGLSVTSAGFGALPFGGGSTSDGSGSGDALVGCFPLSVDVCPGIGSSVAGVSGGSVGVSLVGVPVVSGVSGFGGFAVSWGLSSASLGVLSAGGGGSAWRGVLGVSGLGAGGFVPGVVGVSGSVGVGSEVVVDGVAHRGLVFGSRLAPAGFVDVAGSVDTGVGGSVGVGGSGGVSDVEFGSVGGLTSGSLVGSPVEGRVAGLGRFADWWLVRSWVEGVVGGVGRATWGDVVGAVGSGSVVGVELGLGLGFVAGSEGYGSPVGEVVSAGGSAGLFGGSGSIGSGFVGGVVDVPAGSPVVGLGVDLVDVAGYVGGVL